MKKKKKKVEKTYMKINCYPSYRYNLYLLFTKYKLLSVIFRVVSLMNLKDMSHSHMPKSLKFHSTHYWLTRFFFFFWLSHWQGVD